MRRFGMGTRPELALAGAILLAALGVDLLWLRPQERELRTLLERRDAAEQAAAAAEGWAEGGAWDGVAEGETARKPFAQGLCRAME